MVLKDPSPAEVKKFLKKEITSLWKEAGLEEIPERARARLKRSQPMPPPPPPAEGNPSLQTLEEIRAWIGDCKRCGLCEARHSIVFGTGDPKAELMFVGEGPGADEDAQGLPFVGRAGKLLDKIIEAMGRERAQVYIGNIVKCRPPSNRVPEPSEAQTCLPFLKEQIRLVHPKLIVALGSTATLYLLGQAKPMTQTRGQIFPLSWDASIPVLPTYHPAYLLRNPPAKKLVWEDMQKAMRHLGSH